MHPVWTRGCPRTTSQLAAVLEGIGRSVDEVRAVLLTHVHQDHIGLAERLRRETGATVRPVGCGHFVLGSDGRIPHQPHSRYRSQPASELRRPTRDGSVPLERVRVHHVDLPRYRTGVPQQRAKHAGPPSSSSPSDASSLPWSSSTVWSLGS
ncbi:MBL fold metallo-hydrolase [bacterium RCC_150]